jgi:hypothetical protein
MTPRCVAGVAAGCIAAHRDKTDCQTFGSSFVWSKSFPSRSLFSMFLCAQRTTSCDMPAVARGRCAGSSNRKRRRLARRGHDGIPGNALPTGTSDETEAGRALPAAGPRIRNVSNHRGGWQGKSDTSNAPAVRAGGVAATFSAAVRVTHPIHLTSAKQGQLQRRRPLPGSESKHGSAARYGERVSSGPV